MLLNRILSVGKKGTSVSLMCQDSVKPLLPQIGNFLYKVYIEENKWQFGKDNPSQIKIKRDPETGLKMFTDKFMNKSIWAVAQNDKNEVIGCIRAIYGENIELFGYAHRSRAIRQLMKQNKKFMEMNRLAVHPSYRRTPDMINSRLSLAHFKWMKDNEIDCTMVGCFQTPKPPPASKKIISLGTAFGTPFKYEDHDPNACQIHVWNTVSLVKHLVGDKPKARPFEVPNLFPSISSQDCQTESGPVLSLNYQ